MQAQMREYIGAYAPKINYLNNYINMHYVNQKTPLLKEGTAQSAMQQFLTIIKSHRGLTSYLEKHGINGKLLQPDKPYNIRFSMLVNILEKATQYRETDEEFRDEWNHMCLLFLKIIKS